MDYVQNCVISKSRTLGENFGYFLKILSPIERGGKIFFNVLSQNGKRNIHTYNLFQSALTVGTKPWIEKKMYGDVSVNVQ